MKSTEQSSAINRRTFTRVTAAMALTSMFSENVNGQPEAIPVHQATGTRVGEVTDHSAIVWTRLTAASMRVEGSGKQVEGACPGASGRVRVRYGIKDEFGSASESTDWVEVGTATDFIHQFVLQGLQPDTRYYYLVDSMDADGKHHGAFAGSFLTAPAAARPGNLRFCVMTCQGYHDRGDQNGHRIYPSMLALHPSFACLTGDLVYYDNDKPRATSADIARYHWQRMFSLPRLIEFNRQVGTYWLKDDHDTLNDDSWPGRSMGSFTFAEGQKIFRQQAPMADGRSYRTFRWGRDLQIWLTDGRDFRSPNNTADGPEKTIWGKEQKAWFKRTTMESDATWKILISPTPMVGPDRPGKNDNHSNGGFKSEGDELREWFRKNLGTNFFVICGDRHWQYHSVHPETGLHEFSVGPASDEHAGGSPGVNPAYHRFHRIKGGFLSTTLKRVGGKSIITFQHHDIDGKVVHEWSAERNFS